MALVRKTSNFKVCMSLIGLVKPLIGFMIMAVGLGVLGHLSATFITIFGGFALLDIMGFQVGISVSLAFTFIVILAIMRGILRYGEQASNHYIAFKLLALIRHKVFSALRNLCPAKLEGRDKGDLIAVITSDIELLEVFYAHTISPMVIAFIISVIMSIFIGSYNLLAGIVAFIAYITVGIVIPLIVSKINGDSGIAFREKSGDMSSYVLESLRGIKEQIQYNTGKERLCEMDKKTQELCIEEHSMKKLLGRNMAVTNTAIYIFDFIMLVCMSILYYRGSIGFEAVLIPLLALMGSYGPVVALANLGSTLQNTFAAGRRVLDILQEKAVVEEVKGKENIQFSGASADKVTFAYGDEDILKDININIKPGTITGIVGKSGCGKSTLLKLFMRFWSTSKGRVSISGVDINNVNTDNLRDMESYMTQSTELFHDSIRNNIKIAKLDATEEEIQEACIKASIHEFIMKLPRGYDTTVGELGDTLSGGEKQRIGLARVFLHNAPFVLLDEPTSNLDSLNEAVILQSLYKERKDKTMILVSHRRSTMHIAHRVISLENIRES